MLTIERIADDTAYPVLVLSGRLAGNDVARIRTLCEQHLQAGKTLTLDLSDISFLDSAGLKTLQELRCRGVALVNCSFYVSTELEKSKC